MPGSATMIKAFKRRFIIITMALVGVVSLVTFIGIAVMNYQQTKAVTDEALQYAVEARQDAGFSLPDLGVGDDDEGGLGTRESSVPVCLVAVFMDGGFSFAISDSSTASMSEDVTEEVIEEVLPLLSAGKTVGLLRGYGLFYCAAEFDGGYRIAFADSSLVMDDFGENVMTLVGLWVLLMLAMFAVTVFLSRVVARPVERAWEDQQRFIADASHELKTPLTIILANVSILQQDRAKTIAEQEAWVEGIGVEAERMQYLTESMLTLAQEDAGVDQQQVMATLDLSSLVEGQILQFDAVAFERSLVIEDDVAAGVQVKGDELRLENLVKTLLENACKYAGQPGTIEVSLSVVRNDAVLTVANDGETIPPEDLPHLFDRFYRSDKARANEGETASFGLGLSIAKSTAEAHGGSIGVTSEKGRTTFTVKLPVAK